MEVEDEECMLLSDGGEDIEDEQKVMETNELTIKDTGKIEKELETRNNQQLPKVRLLPVISATDRHILAMFRKLKLHRMHQRHRIPRILATKVATKMTTCYVVRTRRKIN